MPPKNSDTHVESMEREIEEIKLELQHLPSLKRSIENMAQNFMKLLQSMEETQK